jgi:hypothetical protein
MRLALAFVAVTLACSPALASQPGQPLDCSDWVLSPGYSCSYYYGGPFSGDWTGQRGTDLAIDNLGGLLRLDGGTGIFVNRLDPVAGQGTIAFVQNRPNGSGDFDYAVPSCSYGGGCSGGRSNLLIFDPVGGKLIFGVISWGPGYVYSSTIVISGFPSLFDVLQTYTPPPSQLGFRVPPMPEGLGGADHFDTYWGPLTKPIDFTQAHSLECGYPATPPHVGDYEIVTDALPTPAPDSGYYYLTATTYQGQTRYGRKTSNGKLSGRDPALLPASAPLKAGGCKVHEIARWLSTGATFNRSRDGRGAKRREMGDRHGGPN